MKYIFSVVFCFFLIGSIHSQEKRNFKIAVIIEHESPEFSRFFEQFKSEVIALSGEDANVLFPDEFVISTNYNSEKAVESYRELLSSDADLILLSGESNFKALKGYQPFTKPTILMGLYDLELIGISSGRATSGIENFSYVIVSHTYKEDLKVFKSLYDFKKIGIILEQHIYDNTNPDIYAKPLFDSLDVGYKFIPFQTSDDILQNLDDVDAVYFANSFLLAPDEVKHIAHNLMEKMIPSFTATSLNHVNLGILATNKKLENKAQYIRRLGLMVEDVINGTNLSESPIYSKFDTGLTMNISTARKLGIPINLSLIATTNFVGELDNYDNEKRYSLLEVMNEAIDKNLSLEVSRKDLELAGQDVKASKSTYLPNVTASATASYLDEDLAAVSNGSNPEKSTSGNISLTQTIYSEAATANISIQKSLKKAQQATLTSDQLETVFRAMQAYYQALSLRANLQVRYTNLQLTKKNLQVAQQNFEAGQAGKSDVLRFKSEQANNTQVMFEGISNLKQGYNALNFVLNNPIDLEIEIEDVNLEDDIFKVYRYESFLKYMDNPLLRKVFIDFLFEEAMNKNPDLKAIDYNMDALNRSVKLYSSGRFVPTVGLQGQYFYEFSRSGAGTDFPPAFPVIPDNYYNLGINVSIPLIDQNLQNIKKRTSLIQADQLEVQRNEFTMNLKQSIENIVLNIVNQITNIEISGITLEASEESLDLVQTSYSEGAVTIVQLLDAQNNFLQAKLNKTNATYNYLLAIAELERVVGMFILLNTEEDNQALTERFNTFIQTKN